jgi:hypothetical protein
MKTIKPSNKKKKVINTLRKTGVLRYGTKKGTYTSTKNMPTELFMDNVYDADKDLINKKDVEGFKKKVSKIKKSVKRAITR